MTQIFLFFDCIALTRYMYIFCLKNPAAFKDDFWCRVAVAWIKAFSFLITGGWYFLAGKINDVTKTYVKFSIPTFYIKYFAYPAVVAWR